MLKDIQPGAGSSINFFLGGFKVGNKFLFTATTTANGTELWETDGTDDGTKLFKDIVPGAVGSTPFILPSNQYDIATNTVTNAFFNGNKFFLIANTPANGFELWISDGTSAGTTMVKDINPGTENGAAISSYIYTSSGIYFTADDGVHGEEPWKSDGTDAGTTMVLNLNPVLDDNVDQDSDVSFAFYIINSKVIFSATDGVGTADDLYRLEGTFNPLPVKLGDFTVTPKNADALLEWSTLSEINTKDFTVQRSEDGVKFTPIGTVVAAGSSSNERTYHFTDPGIINSGKAIVYYKLALNDRDGKSESTKVIALKLAGLRELSLKLLGNPVQSAIVIMVSGNTNKVTLSVKDMSGKTISTRAIKANGQISIPASNLAPGAYVIVAESDNSRTLLKFIKN
jgi:ELWxxDGT repeat protein